VLPDDENARFLRAGALLFNGRVDEAGRDLESFVGP